MYCRIQMAHQGLVIREIPVTIPAVESSDLLAWRLGAARRGMNRRVPVVCQRLAVGELSLALEAVEGGIVTHSERRIWL